MVRPAEYYREGYVLLIRSNIAKKFCISCIKDFVAKRPALRLDEKADYVVIS